MKNDYLRHIGYLNNQEMSKAEDAVVETVYSAIRSIHDTTNKLLDLSKSFTRLASDLYEVQSFNTVSTIMTELRETMQKIIPLLLNADKCEQAAYIMKAFNEICLKYNAPGAKENT